MITWLEKQKPVEWSEEDLCKHCCDYAAGGCDDCSKPYIKKEELTEFESWFKKLIGCYASAMGVPLIEQPLDEQNKFVETNAKSLLSIARKQIASEININGMAMGVNWLNNRYYSNIEMNQAYRQGIEDTIKALEKGE